MSWRAFVGGKAFVGGNLVRVHAPSRSRSQSQWRRRRPRCSLDVSSFLFFSLLFSVFLSFVGLFDVGIGECTASLGGLNYHSGMHSFEDFFLSFLLFFCVCLSISFVCSNLYSRIYITHLPRPHSPQVGQRKGGKKRNRKLIVFGIHIFSLCFVIFYFFPQGFLKNIYICTKIIIFSLLIFYSFFSSRFSENVCNRDNIFAILFIYFRFPFFGV